MYYLCNYVITASKTLFIYTNDHGLDLFSSFRYDFFLVSQHVRQGTVSPTQYVVAVDDSGWKPDIIQKLTYKLTHLYYNWPGTVRVPAPCQVCVLVP